MSYDKDWTQGFATSIDDDTELVKLSFYSDDEPHEVLLDKQAVSELITELMHLKKQLR